MFLQTEFAKKVDTLVDDIQNFITLHWGLEQTTACAGILIGLAAAEIWYVAGVRSGIETGVKNFERLNKARKAIRRS